MPRLTNSNGKDDRIDFKFGEDTEVHESCSLTWRGEHYVFGGRYESRQISKIIGCELRNIGKYSIQPIIFLLGFASNTYSRSFSFSAPEEGNCCPYP